MTIDGKEDPRGTAEEQNQADLAMLHEKMRRAKEESDAFEALRRKEASHVFRCGALLNEAREWAKQCGIGWYSLLAEYGIAKETANQAIKLHQNVLDAGYTEEDIEGKRITKAKVEFAVIGFTKKQPKPEVDDPHQGDEAGTKDDADTKKSPQQETGKGGGNRPTAPVAQSAGPEPDGDDRKSEEDQDYDEIEISDLLISRQQQLDEESLVRWNEGRERPFDEDYLLVLLDLGVLTVEGGKPRYLPEDEADLEKLVGVLADKLAPVLERWATPDDVLLALKDLIFSEAAVVEEPKTETTGSREQKKRTVRVRRSGQPRA